MGFSRFLGLEGDSVQYLASEERDIWSPYYNRADPKSSCSTCSRVIKPDDFIILIMSIKGRMILVSGFGQVLLIVFLATEKDLPVILHGSRRCSHWGLWRSEFMYLCMYMSAYLLQDQSLDLNFELQSRQQNLEESGMYVILNYSQASHTNY